MAKFKPIRIGDTVPLQQIQPATEEVDGKLYVSQSGVVLGRASAGDGPHEEILFGDLPGGGGASYTEITYADMTTALSGGTLTPGGWYLITDAPGTDLGFLTHAVTENSISVAGIGGYLNADFQAVGNYDGVEAIVGIAAGTRQGIWRPSFEALAINYVNLDRAYIDYTTSSGLLSDGEGYATPGAPPYIYYIDASGLFTAGEIITGDDNGSTAVVVSDDGAGTLEVSSVTGDWTTETTFFGGTSANTAFFDGYNESVAPKTGVVITDTGSRVYLIPDETLETGDVITGDISGNTITVDFFHAGGGTFAAGDTITGGTTGATAVIVTDDGVSSMTAYMTSAGVAFDGSEVLDNGSGVTADQDGAATGPTIVLGDIVIWNLLHWQLTDDTLLDGTDPATNTAAYTVLYKQSQNVGYIEVWDIVEFDYIGNQTVEFRQDSIAGGTVRGETGIVGYQFGRYDCLENNINTPGIFDIINLIGKFRYNTVYQNVNISGIVTGADTAIENNILENGGALTGITAGTGCSISRNKIGQGATLGGSTTMGDGAAFNDLDIRANKQISNKAIDAGVTFSDKIVQLTTDTAETYSANVEGNRIQPGFSDIPGTIDITGLTTLDCTAAWAQYRGIYNLTSSNATEAIDTITNPPTAFPFTLRPAAGLVLTITGTAYSGIGAGQIALKAASYVLDGDKGEYIVLEIDPLGTGCLVEKFVVNGLL